jgi:hypothetical protein
MFPTYFAPTLLNSARQLVNSEELTEFAIEGATHVVSELGTQYAQQYVNALPNTLYNQYYVPAQKKRQSSITFNVVV